MKNYIKGIIIGVANIIPGVSGGTLLVTTGLYEKVLDGIRRPFQNIKFFFILFAGVATGVLAFSWLITFALEHLYIPTMFLFVGLIVGGIITFYKSEISKLNGLYVLIGLSVIVVQPLLGYDFDVSVFSLLLAGFLTGAAMIVPGVSGAMLLLVLGLYPDVLSMISSILKFDLSNVFFLIIFLIGAGVGFLVSALGIRRIIQTHRLQFMNIVLGLIIGSILMIIPLKEYNLMSLLGIPLFFMGYFIAKIK